MKSTKLTISFLVFAYAALSFAIAAQWDYEEYKGNKEKLNSAEVSECDKGACKKEKCNCCPGYGLIKGYFFPFSSDSCKECYCGENYSCTFEYGKKTCLCPEGYDKIRGVCINMYGACETERPKCIETGGICVVKHNLEMTCKCPLYSEYEKSSGCRDICENVCGNEPGVTCNGDKTKREEITCGCDDDTKVFNKDMLMCKENLQTFCQEVCGTDPEVICDGYVSKREEIACDCKDSTKVFDMNSKECKNKLQDVCTHVCGEDPEVTCNSDKTKIEEIRCGCKDDAKVFDKATKICKNPQEKCKQEKPKCVETGGYCIEKDRVYKCICPQDNVYAENSGCNAITHETTSTITPRTTPASKPTTTEMTTPLTSTETTEPTIIDPCILKMINNECSKPNEHCERGECKCKKNYRYSEDKERCEVDKCASCPKNAHCDPDLDNPCECRDGYFNGTQCIKYNKCEIGISKCQQKCNIKTGKCSCGEGFTLNEDMETCEMKDGISYCDLDCSPGICVEKHKKMRCICPEVTHKFVNNTCIDYCTLYNGKPPKNINCPRDCESDDECGLRCKCKDPYEQAEDGIHCRRKEMCKEAEVIDECNLKFALCREVPIGKGYECYCDRDFIKTFRKGNEVCTDKCYIKRDECKGKNAVCELNEEYNAECRCPTLLSRKYKFSTCNEMAHISYSAELSFLKSMYVVENEMSDLYKESEHIISFPKLKRDLKEAVHYVYGEIFKDVKIVEPLNCNVDEDLISCVIELQLEKEPKDLDALLSPSYCYTLPKGFCIVKNLIIKREKSLNIFKQTNPCVVKDLFCDKSTICEPDLKRKSFKCFCKEGFLNIGSFNPVRNEGNLVEKCADINECTSNEHRCPGNTICINTYGSYECICKDGFRKKTGNLDPKKHGCEVLGKVTVTVPDKTDKKYIFIIGGVIGASLLIIFIIVVTFYRKLKKSRNAAKRFHEHRQKPTSVEIVHIDKNETSGREMIPASIHKNRKLSDGQMGKHNRMPRNRIIPRVQLPSGNSSGQVQQERPSNSGISPNVSHSHQREDQKVQRTVHYYNKAYDFED